MRERETVGYKTFILLNVWNKITFTAVIRFSNGMEKPRTCTSTRTCAALRCLCSPFDSLRTHIQTLRDCEKMEEKSSLYIKMIIFIGIVVLLKIHIWPEHYVGSFTQCQRFRERSSLSNIDEMEVEALFFELLEF